MIQGGSRGPYPRPTYKTDRSRRQQNIFPLLEYRHLQQTHDVDADFYGVGRRKGS